jgi:type II secretory pathway component HofQ
MDHVSRPLLIALAATVALMAVWLVALRPGPVAVENTPLAPTKAIPQARQAAAISDAANAKAQAAAAGAGEPAPAAAQAQAPAAPAPAVAAPKTADPAAPASAAKRSAGARRDAAVVRAVSQGKVVVLLFWNAEAADDIATRGALRTLDRHHGKVVVRVVSISDVARYPSVTKGVKIAQSPTTVIIGRKGRTRVISGLTESHELAQAVGDALAGR